MFSWASRVIAYYDTPLIADHGQDLAAQLRQLGSRETNFSTRSRPFRPMRGPVSVVERRRVCSVPRAAPGSETSSSGPIRFWC